MNLTQLVQLLSNLSGPDQVKILPKISRFANRDAQPEIKNGPFYHPNFAKMDIVHCDFTGVGYEWDGGHYAVVWEVNPLFDSIMVIPTTSQPRREYANVFPVGQIPGLNQNTTTLLVSDMTRVSRKRLDELRWNHPRKGNIRVVLAYSWMSRIVEAIAVTYGNEITFADFLANNFGVAMVPDLALLHRWKFRPVKCNFDSNTLVLTYRLWNETNPHQVTLKNPRPGKYISQVDKKKLIKDLLSDDQATRTQAEALYSQLYQ